MIVFQTRIIITDYKELEKTLVWLIMLAFSLWNAKVIQDLFWTYSKLYVLAEI